MKLVDIKELIVKYNFAVSPVEHLASLSIVIDEKGEKGEKHENKVNNSTSSNRATKIRKRLRYSIDVCKEIQYMNIGGNLKHKKNHHLLNYKGVKGIENYYLNWLLYSQITDG
jgi:hypothetical protein